MLIQRLRRWTNIKLTLGQSDFIAEQLYVSYKITVFRKWWKWKSKNIYNDRRPINIIIQINQKELAKTFIMFMMISNWKNLRFLPCLWSVYKYVGVVGFKGSK